MGSNLLIDIGNSAVKLASGTDGSRIHKIKSCPYRKSLFKEDLTHIIKQYLETSGGVFERTAVSTVNKRNNIISSVIKKLLHSPPLYINEDVKLPIKINYKTTLGADRICSSSATYYYYKQKQILVVDFGTATTYNLIIDGVFMGGMISAGIKTSVDSLISNSSLPAVSEIKFNKDIIAQSTGDAIVNGALYPALFASEGIIKELKKKYKELFVIFTGGFSEVIGKERRTANEIDKNLVLKGINIISQLNED